MEGNPETSSVHESNQKVRVYLRKKGGHNATGHKPDNGYIVVFMHLIKGYIGTGIFAMGDAFKNSGMGLGPPTLIVIGIINLHCQHILIAAARRIIDEEPEEDEVKPTFGETVEYTLDQGPPWFERHASKLAHMVNVFVLITEFGFCCVYYVFIAEHLVEITGSFGYHFTQREMLAIILIPIWLSTFLGNLRLLAPLSIIANVLMLLSLIFVFYYTTHKLKKFGDEGQVWIAGETLPLYFGTALFAYEGITFVIPLRNEMRDPKNQYDSLFGVLNVGVLSVSILMCVVGALSYWKYGIHIKGSVFMNFAQGEIIARIGRILVSIAVLFTFTLHMYIPFEVSYPIFYAKYGPFKHPYFIMTIYRTVPVILTYVLANVVPYLSLFISLVGSSTGSFLALILPPILELVGKHGKLGIFTMIKDYLILTMGIIGATTGCALSIYEIVLKFRQDVK